MLVGVLDSGCPKLGSNDRSAVNLLTRASSAFSQEDMMKTFDKNVDSWQHCVRNSHDMLLDDVRQCEKYQVSLPCV